MFKGFEPIGKIIREHFKNIEELYQSGSHISGVPSPFEDLDSLTSGFQKSDLIIVAGRPGMGKTSFALNLGQHLALKQKTPVGVFSLEMSSEQLVTRLLCSEARIDSNKLRRGYLKSNEYAELAIVAGYLAEAPIYIDDSAGLSTWSCAPRRVVSRPRRNIGMLMIDYLQLVSVKERVENRQQQISLISRGMKALAKELNIPGDRAVAALARGGIARRRQASDAVGPARKRIHRAGRGRRAVPLSSRSLREPDDENRGKAELIIGKQRNGPTGTVKLTFIDSCTRFEPAAFGEYSARQTHGRPCVTRFGPSDARSSVFSATSAASSIMLLGVFARLKELPRTARQTLLQMEADRPRLHPARHHHRDLRRRGGGRAGRLPVPGLRADGVPRHRGRASR